MNANARIEIEQIEGAYLLRITDRRGSTFTRLTCTVDELTTCAHWAESWIAAYEARAPEPAPPLPLARGLESADPITEAAAAAKRGSR